MTGSLAASLSPFSERLMRLRAWFRRGSSQTGGRCEPDIIVIDVLSRRTDRLQIDRDLASLVPVGNAEFVSPDVRHVTSVRRLWRYP
jgi:hypothetical protein